MAGRAPKQGICGWLLGQPVPLRDLFFWGRLLTVLAFFRSKARKKGYDLIEEDERFEPEILSRKSFTPIRPVKSAGTGRNTAATEGEEKVC